MGTNKEDRVGRITYNNFGSKMKIIRYGRYSDIDVAFENGWICHNKTYGNFKTGSIKSPYCKSVMGVGFLGEGKYRAKIDGIQTIQYQYWKSMITRCYNDRYILKYPTYKTCTVCEEWHNFQNFGDWFDRNYYQVDKMKMHLDKDILTKGNKIYSKHTCIFVTGHINMMITKNDSARGAYPIGVHWQEKLGKYISACNNEDNVVTHIGVFDNEIDAFLAYKHKKEEVIKQVADKYKDSIPKKLYDAMYRYEVEITD